MDKNHQRPAETMEHHWTSLNKKQQTPASLNRFLISFEKIQSQLEVKRPEKHIISYLMLLTYYYRPTTRHDPIQNGM
jgi:hypothetical protein